MCKSTKSMRNMSSYINDGVSYSLPMGRQLSMLYITVTNGNFLTTRFSVNAYDYDVGLGIRHFHTYICII